MRLLYDLGIWFYGMLLRGLSVFHRKARLWVDGRKGGVGAIEQTIEKGQKHIWFHFASLGEFEQGRSVLEQIKKRFPQEKIVITFFSPSGFEIRKNTPLADYVFYLPEDTKRNARRFIAAIQPKFAVFTKYEYWYHYFDTLKQQDIQLLMISAIFREEQLFFKPYGGFYRQMLKKVSFFFTQNMDSVHMLKWIGITNAGLAGDTRFDRVVELPRQHVENRAVERFSCGEQVLVAGSTWPKDELLLQSLIAESVGWKLVLAPHEIDRSHINEICELFPGCLLYSQFASYEAEELQHARVLVIDNIGMLSSLYYYADIAYIGGGFGAGIHNTLEAVAYGKPVIFGPKYEKFQEALDLVTLMVGFSISNYAELREVFAALQDVEKRKEIGNMGLEYVKQRAGATQIIMKYLETEGLLDIH
ncbi:3-deoxy-D-manno-octulosonic acid transferase [Sphingobacterium yanglingense]|uniref:3-deoxy-D-manno-octulosonic acid transferase n=1 Tax=Sphingobacterium yanglingense TaxID=1437280 RepID=A0A4R6W9Q0_9SPHI|nr:glycosyltransferase N-terminal domain-containing protein [Sphingobacterium yanglingense]TDQ75921.1 3-deoxy-D-manno-octulosonic-acid transferase [Sphingobacterium yanglingense]